MVKAVIFDLDGLLADTEEISFRIFQQMLAPYGIGFTLQDYVRRYCGRTEKQNLADFVRDYPTGLTVEQCRALVAQLEAELLGKGVALKKGGRELLQFLKENGYAIALATSSKEARARKILDDNGVTGFFNAFVFAADIQNSKPHPEIFRKAAEKLGCAPDEALVLEDSEAGVEAAYKAGIPVINIPDLKDIDDTHKAMADAQLESLLDVIEYLQK